MLSISPGEKNHFKVKKRTDNDISRWLLIHNVSKLNKVAIKVTEVTGALFLLLSWVSCWLFQQLRTVQLLENNPEIILIIWQKRSTKNTNLLIIFVFGKVHFAEKIVAGYLVCNTYL